ncbi:DUF2939 domain-containing protein [Massilia dura]|uniref:DUF2939 domain-containing protein n=1 Tax=Pseudoduganella dura TaxID=321982 RepID=A0A6I3XEV7_9BURK|nr:DUF2939 domain-containing protein [Pseudoduganella dura]MUI12131.1 DUF2939 domain-containing protein [Pseudoduganella dura]GGX91728.1 hypothetical protein GCM10007386_23290 [Pseudoduganella dura]
MSNQRIVPIAIALLLLLAAAFWHFSPYLTLHAMRSAARAHDAAALAPHVDFPRVRESLKRQLHAATERKARDAAGTGTGLAQAGAAFGAMLGNLVADKLVDSLVTAERLADAMREGQIAGQAEDENEGQAATAGKAEKRWTFERDGADVFIARALDSRNEPAVGFVFERRGFATWRLVSVELPRPRE